MEIIGNPVRTWPFGRKMHLQHAHGDVPDLSNHMKFDVDTHTRYIDGHLLGGMNTAKKYDFSSRATIVVEYLLAGKDETSVATVETAFFRAHSALIASNPVDGRSSAGDTVSPTVLSKFRHKNRLWVLFDCDIDLIVYGKKGDFTSDLVKDIPEYVSRQSIWSYVGSLWRGRSTSIPFQGSHSFVLIRPVVKDSRSVAGDAHIVFIDFLSLKNLPPQAGKTLHDEVAMLQSKVDEGMGYVEALSWMALAWKNLKDRVKFTRNLNILKMFIPVNEARSSNTNVQEWTRKLLSADPGELKALLRNRRILQTIEKTAPRVADLVASGNYEGAEREARRIDATESELRQHAEIADATDEIMAAFVRGDVDEAENALDGLKRKKILLESIPGMQSALQSGDEEGIRQRILEYRRRHKLLDDELDREDGGLLQKFSRMKFGKALRDRMSKFSDVSTKAGRRGRDRDEGDDGRSNRGGSISSGDWVIFRWFDFGAPDKQWVRREH